MFEDEEIKPPKTNIILIILVSTLLLIIMVVLVVLFFRGKNEYRLIKVKSFEGSVKLQRDTGEVMDVFSGLRLISEDRVDVEKESMLELLADEDKHIIAEENTGFILSSQGTRKKGNITVRLLYGKALFTIDKKLNKASGFEVRTPNAIMSVRGTKFSVQYDAEKNETSIEVMEGKVQVLYEDTTRLLGPGETLLVNGNPINNTEASVEISNEGNNVDINELNPVLPEYEEAPGEARFMLSRYYQNTPDYLSAGPDSLEITLYEEGETPSVMINMGEQGTSPVEPLAQNAIEIDEQYIEPVMDRVNAMFEEQKHELIRDYSMGNCHKPVEVTDWFENFENHEVRLDTEAGAEYIEWSRVYIDWIYVFSPSSIDGDKQVFYPLDYTGEDGMQYSISAVTFIFYEP